MDTGFVIVLILLVALVFFVTFLILLYVMNLQYEKSRLQQELDQRTFNISHNEEDVIHGIPSVATRPVSKFTQVGILTSTSTSDERILPLYGRRVHTRSSKWNYYTFTDGYQKIELPVKHDKDCMNEYGCNELYTDDDVLIPGYKASFKVTIYKNTYVYYAD